MTSHPYSYDIKSSIFMTSYPLYMISPILFHENKTTIPAISPTVFDITATVSVWSHPLCQCLHDFTPLYLSHYIHCIHYIKHPIYDITHMAIQTLYVASDPLYLTLHPLCHQTQGFTYTTPTLCMTSQTLYMWHHIQYACYHNNCLWHYTPLYITSHPVYLWYNIQFVRYHHIAFMTTQWLYQTSHPPYFTSQPLHLCCQTHSINAFTTVMEVFTLDTRLTS